MDDIAEQRQIADEITNAISNPVGFNNDIDEDDLLRELQELQDEDVENELLNIPNAPSHNLPMPSTSKNSATAGKSKKQYDDEDELQRMAAWANS